MNTNIERMAGAKECITALAKLEYSAENLPQEADDAAIYAALQSGDAETLVAQFGPLTPRQQGAFMALAEYIHCSITTGVPDLGRWLPDRNTGAWMPAYLERLTARGLNGLQCFRPTVEHAIH